MQQCCTQLQHFVVLQRIYLGDTVVSREISGYVSEARLALILDITVWGLRAWRRRGYGPKAIKIGRTLFYAESEVAAFLDPASGD